MIVKCEQCQTRFKIPDEKVTEKGVKVRCTKCQHTFRVTKAAAAPPKDPEAATSGPKPFDPFEVFGPAETKPAPKAPIPARGKPAAAPTPEPPDDPFDAPTRVGTLPIPEAARPPPGATPVARIALKTRTVAVEPAPSAFDLPPHEPSPPPPPATAFELTGPQPAPPSAPAVLPSLFDTADEPASSAPPARDGLFGDGSDPLSATGSNDIATGHDRGMFDIPPPPPPAAPELPPAEPDDPPPARVTIGLLKPAGKPEDARGIPEPVPRPNAAKRVTGIAANLAVAAVLLSFLATVGIVYLNEGKFDLRSLSTERLQQIIFPPRAVVAVDVSNGLYETQHGRPVFYVRGEVENRGSRTGKVRVRAEILDGQQLVRASEAYAGAVPSPEELFNISTAADVDALTQKLDRAAPAIGQAARAPFVLVFFDYPPDLSPYRLRVTVQEDGARTAAR